MEHRHLNFDEVNLRTKRLKTCIHVVHTEPVPTACIGTLQKEEHIKYNNLLRTGTTYMPVLRMTCLSLLHLMIIGVRGEADREDAKDATFKLFLQNSQETVTL